MRKSAVSLFFVITLISLLACNTTQKIKSNDKSTAKAAVEISDFPIMDKSFAGIVFRNLKTDSILFSHNKDRYFRAASNTKILTLYNSLKSISDSLTTYEIYEDANGKRILVPRADPTYLNPYFGECNGNHQLNNEVIDSIDLSRWTQPQYGLGWMWDDFNEIYALPLSPMPIYGNMLKVVTESKEGQLAYHFTPENHGYQVAIAQGNAYLSGDTIYLPALPQLDEEYLFPLKNAHEITTSSYKQKSDHSLANSRLIKTVKGCALDTIYKAMMYPSDNFLAEYLLLNAGEKYTKTYNTLSAIDTLSKLHFSDFTNPPKWVDGSGMSHYNLINPTFLVQLLADMWKTKGNKIHTYFPEGGRQGTIKNLYGPKAGKTPYVYAKTGTISNVYCLSGYLIAQSGNQYAFSIMVNNFLGGATPVRREIQRLLEQVRDGY
jgi:serine-type D-Ala-D-Ala carboxypeptidase/endopeptidase (penicillin-binding protein 4)